MSGAADRYLAKWHYEDDGDEESATVVIGSGMFDDELEDAPTVCMQWDDGGSFDAPAVLMGSEPSSIEVSIVPPRRPRSFGEAMAVPLGLFIGLTSGLLLSAVVLLGVVLLAL